MSLVAAVVLVVAGVAGVAALEEPQCGEVGRESCPQLQTYIVGRWHVARGTWHVARGTCSTVSPIITQGACPAVRRGLRGMCS